MSISSILYELRVERGVSQKELAEAIGVSQSTIAKIEVGRNEATASTIRKLASYFNISTDYLLEIEDDFGVRVDDKEKKPDTLSAEERRLLEGYREINAAGKKLVMQTVETLRGTAAGSGRGANQSKIS